mgnify:CR=1 FL=1
MEATGGTWVRLLRERSPSNLPLTPPGLAQLPHHRQLPREV